ncbi:MAG: preprotein translocase subunit SecG [Aquificaceae bacterium]|nr:preprotein translocase subunit SecG [Aquificaceae bacterium]MDW8237282.1 preprotein translocase subunit SecG [Aquificaceae bacterium]
MYYILLTVFVLVALFLIILVLLQRSKGDVGSAFGAMGQGMFGPGGVETILTKATYYTGFLMMFLALMLALVHPSRRGSLIKDEGKQPSKDISIPQPQGQTPPNLPPDGSKPASPTDRGPKSE